MLQNRLLLALIVVVGVPAVLVGYVALIELFVGRLPSKVAGRIRPWLWIGPALLFLGFYLVYPAINTIVLSFYNANSTKPVGLNNYIYFFSNPNTLISLRNNAFWLIFLPIVTVVFGLLFAVLFDRVRYESTAKAIVFLPMAVSFVAASVIWKLQYDYQPPGQPQTGTLNAILQVFGINPTPWLINQASNNPALIWVGVWMWTGFALIILSAGLKSIPNEILEAARVDGATETEVLRFVTIPMLGSTIAVVLTTMIINALKIFDIVYTLTSGNYNTNVIALRMYQEMFNYTNLGRASAIAVVLLIAIVPVMLFNIQRFREQEAIR